ncbi:MAG: Antiporter protein [Firmicutes bacterium]|nr:Antiporter protein [Bacillota bacterium]
MGTIFLASRKSVVGIGNVITVTSIVFAMGLIAFSLSTTLWLSLGIAVIMGFGIIAQLASTNTIVQTLVDEDKRGRVMSLYVVSFGGVSPIGSLLAGHLAGLIGTTATFSIAGVLILVGAGIFAWHLPAWRSETKAVLGKKRLTQDA